MSAKTDHYCFKQPKDIKSKVWRYMDFTKFLSLISDSKLFLARADKLGDPFEGSYAIFNIKNRTKIYKDLKPEHLTSISEMHKTIIPWTYINCWHMNNNESAAMWKLYSKSDEAIAIQTTYSKLVNSLPDDLFIGLVSYIDYETEWLPEGNLFYPFMHKRKSFSHENEVRIIKDGFNEDSKKVRSGDSNLIDGIYVSIDIGNIIENIFVAPTSPKWYFDLVEKMAVIFKVNANVQFSKLDSTPVY